MGRQACMILDVPPGAVISDICIDNWLLSLVWNIEYIWETWYQVQTIIYLKFLFVFFVFFFFETNWLTGRSIWDVLYIKMQIPGYSSRMTDSEGHLSVFENLSLWARGKKETATSDSKVMLGSSQVKMIFYHWRMMLVTVETSKDSIGVQRPGPFLGLCASQFTHPRPVSSTLI